MFLAVGCIDLFHTLSYYGMPPFITENTVQKPTWFWLIARFTEYASLVFIYSIRDRAIDISKGKIFIVIPLLFSLIVCVTIVVFETRLPILVEPGVGVTDFKRAVEYVNTAIILLLILIFLKRYNRSKDSNLLYLIQAFSFFWISQLVFTLYKDVYDVDNFLGHVYKIIGSYYLLKGFYISMIEEPYKKKLAAEESLRKYQQQQTSRILHAQEEERKRLSRELHDRVGQELYSVSIGLNLLELECQKSNTSICSNLESTKTMLSNAMDEVKSIALALRPSALDHLGLIPALKTHIDTYETINNIHVEFHHQGYRRQSIEIETALYRVCVESLLNIAKYAHTKKVTIHIVQDEHGVTMTITDYGVGFDLDKVQQSRDGIGLFSMRERMQQINGKVAINSTPGKGTTVTAWVGLQKLENGGFNENQSNDRR